jgi:putative autoinducer-2 (AI-2) aldolase
MPDVDELKEAKKFYTDRPQKTEGFFLKGSNSLDWGMKNRLSRIFNPGSGRTVMLAIDHGYFQGPTTGLERIDLNILPLVPYADTLMLTRGILRSIVPPATSKSIVLRVSGGTSILKELSNEQIAVDIEESIRLNVCAMAVQVFIGGEFEKESIINMRIHHQYDQNGGYRDEIRDPDPGRYRSRQGYGPGCALFPVGHPDLRRTGGSLHQDLLHR